MAPAATSLSCLVIPEGAGRCQGGFRPAVLRASGFCRAWRHGLTAAFPLIAACSCEPAVRVKDRALGPGRLGGAAGVLDAPAGEPIMAGQGKGRRPRRVWRYGCPIAGWSGVAGLLAAVIPSGVPRPGWPGGMGRFASGPGAGQSLGRPRRGAGGTGTGGGQTKRRPRARPGRQQVMPPGARRTGRARRAGRRTPE